MLKGQNESFLNQVFPQVNRFLQENVNAFLAEPLEVCQSHNGMANLSLQASGNKVYFHSQYDPQHEALRSMEKYSDELADAEHVIFFGVGMGYHITAILQRFPHLTYSIYDPYPAVFYYCMQQVDYRSIYLHKAKNIYLGNFIDHYLNHFVSQALDKVVIVPQNAYMTIFAEPYKRFLERFSVQVKEQRLGMGVNVTFQRLWTVNALQNFSKVIKTPNIFRQFKGQFTNKPILLVSAGPSLEEEYEHLRTIKSQGTAYLIAVGSANRALIAENIYPDAVCSYDPSTVNHEVYKEIIEGNIDSIPLIFGSTVGFQTVKLYPGPKIHMITSQDSIANYLIDEEITIINDAPSIAVIALELFSRLGCNRIILVGQNFAYKNNQYYSKGIAYSDRSTELSNSEQSTLLEAESVNGGKVFTSAAHNMSRNVMEVYISRLPGIDMINTTSGGAQIKGTRFIPLDEVMRLYLQDKVVAANWFEAPDAPVYDYKSIFAKQKALIEDHGKMERFIMNTANLIKKLEVVMKLEHGKKIDKMILKFNDLNRRIYDNKYYNIALQPMVRTQYAILQKELGNIQREKDLTKKAAMIISHFGSFVLECQLVMRDTDVFYQHFVAELREMEEMYLQSNKNGGQDIEYRTDAVVGK